MSPIPSHVPVPPLLRRPTSGPLATSKEMSKLYPVEAHPIPIPIPYLYPYPYPPTLPNIEHPIPMTAPPLGRWQHQRRCQSCSRWRRTQT